jgi:hypothetical protein
LGYRGIRDYRHANLGARFFVLGHAYPV